MALSATLSLRQNQSLVMTPQLIQSIRLLQLTHLELISFIEHEVERNPLLELGSEGDENDGFEPADRQDDSPDIGDWIENGQTSEGEDVRERLDISYENVFPDDTAALPAASPELLDSWRSMPGANGQTAGDSHDLDNFIGGHRTLRAHVDEQAALLIRDPGDRIIATEIADHLDEAGYVDLDVLDIAERLGVEEERVRDVHALLQQCEPAGLFARSLSECLALQLAARERLDPAMRSFVDHLDLVARRDFASLRKLCGVDDEDLIDMLAEIRSLDPKPGLVFQSGPTEMVVADVIVRRAPEGGWRIDLNAQTLPRVLVNHAYHAHVSKDALRKPEDQAFLAECLQNANWLTRSLDQRARTILKVAQEIVRQQDGFLLHGVTHLRPLNLRAVADAIGMHESTVSRVTSNKYMMTPRGAFELKYFFTVPIASSAGGEAHSAEAVRQIIRKTIAAETPDAVLSDDDIVKSLKSKGVDIARRTVAKYRESMNIASSVQRRREKKAMASGAAS